MTSTVTLQSLVDANAPIRYGILKPGPHVVGGVPVVKVRDYDHSGIDVASVSRTAPDIDEQYRRSRLRAGDIVMSIRGTAGIVAIVPAELDGANITQDTARIRIEPIERDYLYQVLHAPTVRAQIRLHTVGQAVKGINIASVRKLQIPWPAPLVRHLIARVLKDCDTQRRDLAALIDAKRRFKRGLTQQVFTGQKRFPEFRDRPWPSATLRDLVQPVTRRNTGRVALVLTASGEHGLVDQRRYFSRKVAGEDISGYFLLRRGEFAYNRSAMNGYPCGATNRLDEHEEGALSTLCLCFGLRSDRLDSDFLKRVFAAGVLNRQLGRIVRVGARAHGLLNVTASEYFGIRIPFPDLDEQRRIASLLNSCDSEIDLLEQLYQQAGQQKRALLSNLLSGDLEVPSS